MNPEMGTPSPPARLVNMFLFLCSIPFHIFKNLDGPFKILFSRMLMKASASVLQGLKAMASNHVKARFFYFILLQVIIMGEFVSGFLLGSRLTLYILAICFCSKVAKISVFGWVWIRWSPYHRSSHLSHVWNRYRWMQREKSLSVFRMQLQKYMGQLRLQLWWWSLVHSRPRHMH